LQLNLQFWLPFEPAGENFYWTHKIPAIQAIKHTKGMCHRELAMQMEKLPASLVIHKRVDTMDTRLAQMKGQLANNPLESATLASSTLDDTKFQQMIFRLALPCRVTIV
jgi:hypothetical protein